MLPPRGYAAARLPGLGGRTRQGGGGMDVCLVSVALSGTVLCVGLITRSEVVPSVLCLTVIVKLCQREGPGQLGAAATREIQQITESVRLQLYLQGQFPFTPRNSPAHSSWICTVSPISKGSPYRVSPRQLYTAAKKENYVKLKL
jgi:hypothetical protein